MSCAVATRADIDRGTIESRKPPEPDISCATLSGERPAFELAELCTPEIAKAVGDDFERGGGATFAWSRDPTHAILVKKLRKRYACKVPLDLLCYADGLLIATDDMVLDELRDVIAAEGLGPFRSIWFHGEEGAYRVV